VNPRGKAQAGELIIITDRGEEVAELVPLNPERRAVLDLARSGRAQWSGGRPSGLAGIEVRGEAVAMVVVEDRG